MGRPFDNTEDYAFCSFTFFSFAVVAILFLLVRHLLLTSGLLLPHEYGCAVFFRALRTWIKGLCFDIDDDVPVQPIEKLKGAYAKVAHFGTFSSCIFFLLTALTVVIIYLSTDGFDLIPWHPCRYGIPVSGVIYTLAKSSMYSVLIARLHLAFKGSVYAYSRRTIYPLCAIVAMTQLFSTVMNAWTIRGERCPFYKSTANGSKESNVVKGCSTVAPAYFWAIAGFVDVILVVAMLYLFSSALKAMFNNMSQTTERNVAQSRKDRADLFLLPLKYTVISTVALLSSMLAYFFIGSTNAAFLLAVDSVVNCAALLLMTAKWKPVYILVCTPLLRCVAVTPCLGCADLSELELIDEVVEKQKSLSMELTARSELQRVVSESKTNTKI